jgi:formate hydrogenlyase subunit 3/multisubunit Na+/H+ antiporter MnhD subunit
VSGAGLLLVATLAAPVGMLFACLSRRVREGMSTFLGLAPLPGLAAALLAADGPHLVLDEARRQFTLALDPPGAILLGVAALLWSIAGIYARTYIGIGPAAGRFSEWWLLTLTGSLGVFVAADLVSFYVTFAVVSLAAWGLVVHDGTARARRAGVIYLGLAVFGEICLLMGFVLLAAATPGDSLAIERALALLPVSPWDDATLTFLIAGFGLKMGLVPLHVWLPVAHPAAPMPASAVLSGAIIKAGVIGLIRFLPFEVALPEWGVTLSAVGLLTAFYGVAIGITQANPKTVLAYSSVSQMGLVAAVLGMGLAAGDGDATSAAAFYAAHHVLTKGALFLAVGVVAVTGARRLWPVLLPAAVLALGFGGLPLTGGALAKLAVKAPLGEGVVGLLATLAAAGSTLLMLHFLSRLRSSVASDPRATAPPGLVWPWLGIAFAAVAVPWALFLTSGIGTLAEVIAPADLWKGLWPVLLGAALAVVLRRFGDRLPPVPEGDVLVLGGRAARIGRAFGDWLVRADDVLRQWPIAGVSLLTLALLLGAVLLVQAHQAPG